MWAKEAKEEDGGERGRKNGSGQLCLYAKRRRLPGIRAELQMIAYVVLGADS